MVHTRLNDSTITDAAIKKATGKDWQFWLTVIDDLNWQDKGRPLVLDILNDVYGLSERWSQSVATRYENERGLCCN
jgi:hypothetical protein